MATKRTAKREVVVPRLYSSYDQADEEYKRQLAQRAASPLLSGASRKVITFLNLVGEIYGAKSQIGKDALQAATSLTAVFAAIVSDPSPAGAKKPSGR
jgi:hypothetical protein